MKLIQSVLLSAIISGIIAYPVTHPVYPGTQYVSAQGIPAVQYRQQPQAFVQPQYVTVPQQSARPIYESDKGAGLQKYSTQIKQPIQQVLLANVDRQRVSQAAATPLYLHQIQAAQAAQQQAHAQDSVASQRKAASQILGQQATAAAIHQPQQQTQYILAQNQQTIQRPIAQGLRYVPQQQHQHQHQQRRGETQQEPEEDYDPNPSYQFGFDVNDDLYTNYQNRKEQREGNKITGSYSVVDSDGFVRTVTYTADPKEGFKAEVTRQPTDIVVKIPKPDPQFVKPNPQYVQAIQAQPRVQSQAQKQQPNVFYQYE